VFNVRRVASMTTPLSPEDLSAKGLVVDAWRAKAAEPGSSPEDLHLFLCLYVVAPMLLEFDRFPRSALTDDDVDQQWDRLRDPSDALSDQLLDACALQSGESVSPP
jgi:hypothetical protein